MSSGALLPAEGSINGSRVPVVSASLAAPNTFDRPDSPFEVGVRIVLRIILPAVISFFAISYFARGEVAALQLAAVVFAALADLQITGIAVERAKIRSFTPGADASFGEVLWKSLLKNTAIVGLQLATAPFVMASVEALVPPVARDALKFRDTYLARLPFLGVVLGAKGFAAVLATLLHSRSGLDRYSSANNFIFFVAGAAELAAISLYAEFIAPEVVAVADAFSFALVAVMIGYSLEHARGFAGMISTLCADIGVTLGYARDAVAGCGTSVGTSCVSLRDALAWHDAGSEGASDASYAALPA